MGAAHSTVGLGLQTSTKLGEAYSIVQDKIVKLQKYGNRMDRKSIASAIESASAGKR